MFFHILDTAIVNAHILYNACTDNKLTQLEFRRALAEGLLNGYETAKARRRVQDDHLPLRLKERPFLEPTPDGSRPDCHVCSNRASGHRHQTRYQCKICKTPLCIYPCFEKYHTLINYSHYFLYLSLILPSYYIYHYIQVSPQLSHDQLIQSYLTLSCINVCTCT